ncbi:TPA: hypothetical protein ACTW1K_002339 [Raoultella planticola]
MRIISVNGNYILDTANIHFFCDNSLKRTGFFTFRKQHHAYNCPHRGTVPSYKLIQANDNASENLTFKAYYLPYLKNEVTSVELEPLEGFNYFFTDPLDGCSVGISSDGVVTRVFHANAFKYGDFLYRKERVKCGFAMRRQIDYQKKMIQKKSMNDVKIISPWNYGHYGEGYSYYRTLFFGYKDASGMWTFLRQTYDIRNFENSWFK